MFISPCLPVAPSCRKDCVLFAMRKIVLFLICAGLHLHGNGQTVRFSKYHDVFGTGDNNGVRVEVMPQGYAFTSLHFCSPQSFAPCSALSVTDSLGEIIYSKWFGKIRIEGLRYHSADSTFLFWGDFQTQPLIEDWTVFLLKATYWGDTIWSVNINDPKMDFCRRTVELPDGSILLTSSYRWTNDAPAIVSKVDAEGNHLWTKYYDNGNAFEANDTQGIVPWENSSVMVCSRGIGVDTFDGNNYTAGVALFQLDYDGNVLWDSAYRIAAGTNYAVASLAKLPNGKLAVPSNDDRPGQNEGGAYILGIDEEKSIEWSIGFPYTWPDIIRMHTTLDSNLVGCGSAGLDLYGTWDAYPWLLKISAEGEVMWERFITYDLGNAVNDVLPTPDGGYIVVGNFRDPPSPAPNGQYYVWLLKLDGDGCLQLGCDSLKVTVPVSEPPVSQNSLIAVSPNPADATLTVSVGPIALGGQLRLFDVQGHLVSSISVNAETLAIPTQQLTGGLYWIQCLTPEGHILGTVKVSIQH